VVPVAGVSSRCLRLGLPSSGSVILTTQASAQRSYNALYVQDDYRVTPKLSINYGFRYEHEPGIMNETITMQSASIHRTNPATTTPGTTILGGVKSPDRTDIRQPAATAGINMLRGSALPIVCSRNTVVRGGFGVFYSPLVYSRVRPRPRIHPDKQPRCGVLHCACFVVVTLSNPFPNGLVGPRGTLSATRPEWAAR